VKATVTKIVDRSNKQVDAKLYLTLNGKVVDAPLPAVPLVFPDRPIGIGDHWTLQEAASGAPAKNTEYKGEAELLDFVIFDSLPCARIQVNISSTRSTHDIYGGAAKLVGGITDRMVRVSELRNYIVRLHDGEVAWNETIVELQDEAKFVMRLKLTQSI
jgi:hypothetical protein